MLLELNMFVYKRLNLLSAMSFENSLAYKKTLQSVQVVNKQPNLLYNMVRPMVSEVLLGGYDPVWGL